MSEKSREQWELLGRRCQRAEALLRAVGACLVRDDRVVPTRFQADDPQPGGWIIPDYAVQHLDSDRVQLNAFLLGAVLTRPPESEVDDDG